MRGSADPPFRRSITFHYAREYDGESGRTTYDMEPEIIVTAPNYIARAAPVTFVKS